MTYRAMSGELRDAFLTALDRQGAVKTAGRLVARYLILGHPVEPLIATLTRAVLREDAEFHTYQMLEAGVQQYRQWGEQHGGASHPDRSCALRCRPFSD